MTEGGVQVIVKLLRLRLSVQWVLTARIFCDDLKYKLLYFSDTFQTSFGRRSSRQWGL